MKLIFAEQAWEDYLYWQKQDKRIVERINKLIRETQREPFSGVGKPEALKHALSGFWSRRITDEHRMVYRVEGDDLLIVWRDSFTRAHQGFTQFTQRVFLKIEQRDLHVRAPCVPTWPAARSWFLLIMKLSR